MRKKLHKLQERCLQKKKSVGKKGEKITVTVLLPLLHNELHSRREFAFKNPCQTKLIFT